MAAAGTRPIILSSEERRDWLRLIRSDNVGPITFHRLLNRFGSAAAALDAVPALARRGGARAIRLAEAEDAEGELEALQRAGGHLIARCEADYPEPLTHIEDAPPLIAVIGDATLLARPAVAVVGARNASINGRRLAEEIAGGLGAADVVVVSGLARGIDAAAHRAAVATGTVAVMAGGVDIPYPLDNADLYAEIAVRGTLISEIALGTEPQARHFPRRNRLISGLARGVVVVEAGARSGSLITARMALDQGREVFAVPGSPLDPRARGPNGLLRDGAVLTENAEDVLRVLAEGQARAPSGTDVHTQPLPPTDEKATDEPRESALAEARRVLAEALSPTPVTVDEIVRTCHMSPAVVAAVLLEWELAGRLERHAGNRVALLPAP